MGMKLGSSRLQKNYILLLPTEHDFDQYKHSWNMPCMSSIEHKLNDFVYRTEILYIILFEKTGNYT